MSKTVIGIIIAIIIVGIIFEIWAMATYGNKPLSEVPFWVAWLMLGD